MSLYILYIFELLMGLVERASWIYFGDRWMRRRESCLAVTTAWTTQCLTLYNILAIYICNILTIFVQYFNNIFAIFMQYLCNVCTIFCHNCSAHAMSYFMFLQYFTVSEIWYIILYPTIHYCLHAMSYFILYNILPVLRYLTISCQILPYLILLHLPS